MKRNYHTVGTQGQTKRRKLAKRFSLHRQGLPKPI